MEQKQIYGSLGDRLPPLSTKYPWLVAQDDTGDQIFFPIHKPSIEYRCQIPELVGRHIQGYFHGWVILSNHPQNDMWFLWNPVTSKIIRLPSLNLKNYRDSQCRENCCLTSPPGDPSSVLLITTKIKPTILFCLLDGETERLKWIEMSYAEQFSRITFADALLFNLTCCNGKVYAFSSIKYTHNIIHIDILVKDREVLIRILPIAKRPYPAVLYNCSTETSFLKGGCTGLFNITITFNNVAKETLNSVHLFKLDMVSMTWEIIEDLKGATFFVNFGLDCKVYVSTTELGGYIHIRGKSSKIMYSYDVKNRTVSLTSMPSAVLPTSHVSLWQFRLLGDHDEIKSKQDDKEDEIVVTSRTFDKVDLNNTRNENNESHLLNIPFDILKTIMELCVGVEYMQFRATCKHCQLAGPMIQWSNGEASRRLQTYSVVSPWLMVFDKHQGVITFTDPMCGDKYFMETPQEFIGDIQIHFSKYGWLLIHKNEGALMFFNPFTYEFCELPRVPYLSSFCFSVPPTSPDCMVVGFTNLSQWHVYIHFVAHGTYWRKFTLNFVDDDSHAFRFPTFYDRNLYALCSDGGLDFFIDIDREEYSWGQVLAEGPRSCCGYSAQYFLMKHDQHLVLVIMAEFGESIEIFKVNDSQKWEKMDSLGRHTIYICDSTCLCIEAKIPEMENKIYFPRLHNENGKIVFYSLETSRYHTFNGKNIMDFVETKHHLNPHTWIEPSWS